MARKQDHYKEFEKFLTKFLFTAVGIFLLYLLFAACNVVVLKVILAIFGILLSGLGLFMLHKNHELLRPRGLWLTCGFGSVALLILVSLICRFP